MPNFVGTGDTRRAWNSNANWFNQTPERLASHATIGTETALQNFGNIAQHGLYGQEGINRILKGLPNEMALKRKRAAALLRRKYGRRLGARAGGAAMSGFANEVLAPTFADEIAMGRELRRENEQSKLSGIQGQASIGMNSAQLLNKLWQQSQESDAGMLDFITGLSGMATSIAEIPGSNKILPFISRLLGGGGGENPFSGSRVSSEVV